LDGPITTDADYSAASQRHFSGPSGFSMDDEDNTHRRSGVVGNVPIPATNGLRYNTQQSAMQDLP
jgi:meiosis-specific transcription factor NDT80